MFNYCFVFASLFVFFFFRSWPWPHCCCNSLHWPNRHRSWKTMRIKWATICSRLWLSWALWCAFSSYCPIACWFTVPNKWVIPPKQTQRLRKCSKLTIMFTLVFCLFPDSVLQESQREVSVWLAINLCTIIYVFLIVVFVYDLLVDHETYMAFSNVCILELVLFIADGKCSDGIELSSISFLLSTIVKFIDSCSINHWCDSKISLKEMICRVASFWLWLRALSLNLQPCIENNQFRWRIIQFESSELRIECGKQWAQNSIELTKLLLTF